MNATRRLSLIYPLGLSLLAGAPAALGQTALGTGQGLYRDLQQRNSLASQGRDYAAEARNRNSIVFGRAPGGLSFRGGLGYKDPSEFLGRLGSQDLHSFMSESAFSATVSQGIRAQQAMDQQRALSVGAPRRPGLGGSLETPRGATSSGADLTRSRDSTGALRADPGAVRRDLARHPGNELSSRRPITPAGESGASARGAGLGSGSAFATTGNRGGESGEYGGLLNDRLGVTGRLPSRASSDIESFDTTYGTGPVGGRERSRTPACGGPRTRRVLTRTRLVCSRRRRVPPTPSTTGCPGLATICGPRARAPQSGPPIRTWCTVWIYRVRLGLRR